MGVGIPRRRHFSFLILIAGYLVLAVTYRVVNPPFEAPDAFWHDAHVHGSAAGNGLPQRADVGVAGCTMSRPESAPRTQVTIRRRWARLRSPHAWRVECDGKIILLGFDLDRTRLAPGEARELALWWATLRPLDADDVAFAHLIPPPDAVWAQQEQMLRAGGASTSTWAPRAPHRVAGQVAIGLYDKDSYEGLPVQCDDCAVILAQVKVEHNP